jgi:hypothetical protein
MDPARAFNSPADGPANALRAATGVDRRTHVLWRTRVFAPVARLSHRTQQDGGLSLTTPRDRLTYQYFLI